MTPLGLILLILLAATVLAAPRRAACIAVLVGALYLTQGLTFELAGIALFPTRILAVLGFLRILVRKELFLARLSNVDRAVIYLYIFITAAVIIRNDEYWANLSARAVDSFLAYFIFRAFVRDLDDFRWVLRVLALLLVPYVFLLAVEYQTHSNPFSIVGASDRTWLREDKVRCFGSFRHPSLLGSLGATFFPLYLGLSFSSKSRNLAILGLFLCLGVVFFSNSGGPLSAWAAGCVAYSLWPLRKNMRLFRWGVVISLGFLSLLMTRPIWYLIARVSSLTGGTGWHRSYLIDVAFQDLGSWWFLGMPYMDTRDWFPYVLPETGAADITNQFIAIGVQAGIVAIGIFVLLLVRAFSNIGRTLIVVRPTAGTSQSDELMIWGIGSMLAVNLFNWLGISYFDQFYVMWMFQLGATTSVTTSILESPRMHAPRWDTKPPLRPRSSHPLVPVPLSHRQGPFCASAKATLSVAV